MEQTYYISQVKPNDVVYDPEVNRHYKDARSKAMAKNWDKSRAESGGLVVSQRADGTIVPLDGQHRFGGARHAGQGDVPLRVTVFTGLTKEEEADWVLSFQEDRQSTSPAEAHRLGVNAGRPIDLFVHEVCNKHGVKVTGYKGRNCIAAVSMVKSLAKRDLSRTDLDATLEIIVGAWDGDPVSFDQLVLRGVFEVVRANNGSLDKRALTDKLSKVKPVNAIGEGANYADGNGWPKWRGVANYIVKQYNSRRQEQNKIPVI